MMRKSVPRVERRTCFKCHKNGNIAWNFQQSNNTKQGVSFNSKLKEIHVDKKKQPTEKVDLNKQKWVVKSLDESASDESDSIKSEELSVEKNVENYVPPLDDVNFPPLRAENLKSKGRFEISNQFFVGKKEFDAEKVFNGNVKHIFGKMVDGKVKNVKGFYKSKRWWDRCESKSPKAGQAWVTTFST
ncbi:hypothetical protein Hanom_Chr17g01586811 [Helianthus anomalus]